LGSSREWEKGGKQKVAEDSGRRSELVGGSIERIVDLWKGLAFRESGVKSGGKG